MAKRLRFGPTNPTLASGSPTTSTAAVYSFTTEQDLVYVRNNTGEDILINLSSTAPTATSYQFRVVTGADRSFTDLGVKNISLLFGPVAGVQTIGSEFNILGWIPTQT